MAFVPAVPEAVAAGVTLADVLVALVAVLGWAVCFGLLFAWTYTIGFLLDTIASVLDFKVWRFHVNLGAPLTALDHSVKSSLSAGVSTFDHAMGLFFHWAGLLLAWMANFAMLAAQDTLHLAQWLTGDHLPKYVKWAIRAAFPLPWLTRLIAQEIEKAWPHTGAGHVIKVIERPITKVYKYVGAATLPGAIALPGIRKEIFGLTKRNLSISKRLHRLEALLGVAAFAAAMANVLGLPNWRCLTRGNIGKVARRLCGLGPAALEDLLGLLVDVLIVEDVCQVVTLLEDGLHLIQGPLDSIVGVVGGSLCHGDYDAPPDLAALPLSLPPVTGLAPLAA